ncbi:MAG: GntR family transcriptional regulator [Peptostreptococcaceae bacterium]|nr:GntR family transcriptional regulator [Peptostreptococcaceae bacterium]
MLKIDLRSRTPIYEQIIDSVKEMVVKEVLQPGEKLPSVRELAKLMTLNPNTVQKSYQELERQGIICSVRGKGTFISEDVRIKDKKIKVETLMENIRKLIVEAIVLGLSKEDLLSRIGKIYDEIMTKE